MKKKPMKRGAAEVRALAVIKYRDQASCAELGAKIGVSLGAVYGWIERGRLPAPLALKALRRYLRRDERAQIKKAE